MEPLFSSKKEYRALETLGSGLSSEVYKALCVDLQADFVQTVAIKSFKSPRFLEKFQNELKNLSKINNPHVVSIIDWCVNEDRFFLVTEFIEGLTLDRLLQRQPQLSENLKKYIINETFEGLGVLKKEGLFHGDLKPSNIMISVSGLVKLIDIGCLDFGTTFVTPKYSAPEVLSGHSSNHLADLFSLGIIVKEIGLRDYNHLCALCPGDRKFKTFRVETFQSRNDLAWCVRDAITFEKEDVSREGGENLIDAFSSKTLELASPVQSYKNCSKNQKAYKFYFKWFSALFLFGIIMGFQKPQFLPQVQRIQLRALGAFEVMHDSQWHVLPYNFSYFLKGGKQRFRLKFRTNQGIQYKWIDISHSESRTHIFNIDTL